ncbi:MAG: ABC transporter substrate-binding protein, partial [Acidimicrobiales bacterium]
ATTALAGGLAGATGSSLAHKPAAVNAPSGSGVSFSGISRAECAANRQAGTIIYLSGYDYVPAVSIGDVINAQARGYFKDMCLHVILKPGLSTDDVALVSADRVQISGLGSDSEVLAARAKGANLLGVLTYGHTAVTELITAGNLKVSRLTQLDGKTIGIKGAIPYEVEAMLVKSGVKLASLHQVEVGYDPAIIDQGRIQALPVYKSAEPRELNALGLKYKVWNPTNYGVAASFGVLIVNSTFARRHPSAVADFLRADLEGFLWGLGHKQQTVAYAEKLLDPALGESTPIALFRWRVESGLVLKYTPKGEPIGDIDYALIGREYAQDIQLRLIRAGVNIQSAFDPSFLRVIYRGTTLIWPKKFG